MRRSLIDRMLITSSLGLSQVIAKRLVNDAQGMNIVLREESVFSKRLLGLQCNSNLKYPVKNYDYLLEECSKFSYPTITVLTKDKWKELVRTSIYGSKRPIKLNIK